jgi:mannose-1-phosphate guanylyltransferase/mannose-6-phosphate isomerase
LTSREPASASIDIAPVIMAGGTGSRLWPLSRAGFPKQFLSLTGNSTLFQQSVARLNALSSADCAVRNPLIVGNEDHRFLILEQLREQGVEPDAVLLEPLARNTAPALTLAALHACSGATDPVLVVTPADQVVTHEGAFVDALHKAVRLANDGSIVILGIRPDRPETGYGYIQRKGEHGVERFVEKPDKATAERYLAEGSYFWNGGLFVLRASRWLEALSLFRGDIASAVESAWSRRSIDGKFVRPERAAFEAVPSESVDYAVMERCPGSEIALRMVELDAGWNDLGAWDAVWQTAAKDADGNVLVGDAIANDCRNTLVHATSRLVSVIGLNDAIVVETADAVLVSDRSRCQEVKQVVARLDGDRRVEHALHRKVHRPWGWYDSIDSGPRFQVKRIMVKPGASLSLQKHHHRAEHWVVVTGTAEVTRGARTELVSENQSVYISLGEVHRLSNPGKVPLEIIEVQSGTYLGEDDIVRLDDTYGRA